MSLAGVAAYVVVAACLALPAGRAVAQEDEQPVATSPEQASPATGTAGDSDTSAESGHAPDGETAGDGETPGRAPQNAGPTDKERERAAGIGFVLLAGIVSSGILLIAGVLIWGRRMRRISRQRTDGAPLDPLWYLRGRAPANSVGDGNRPAGDRPEEDPPLAAGETGGDD